MSARQKFETVLDRFGLKSLFRYGVVGIGAASIHALTAFAFKYGLSLGATVSNGAGFVAGAAISYLGSYYFTFETSQSHKHTLPRFIIVWLIGIFVNVGLFHWAVSRFDLAFPLAVFLAIVVTPMVQFLLLKFYAFRRSVPTDK